MPGQVNSPQAAVAVNASSATFATSAASASYASSLAPGGVGYVSEFKWPMWRISPVVSSYSWVDGASGSMAMQVMVPLPVSASYMRLYALMSTQSSSITSATTTINGSHTLQHSFNLVLYSMGVGANSMSLQYVASGSASMQWMNSWSANSNGSEYSMTARYVFPVEGGYTTLSSSLATSSASFNFPGVSDIMSLVSSNRVFDIPFASSLSAGVYWAIFGYSSAQSNGLTDLNAAISNNRCFISATMVAANGGNSSFGLMGSSNRTSGAYFGAGIFSTAGGGTTNSLPFSAISSVSQMNHLAFDLIRRA